MSTSDDRAYLRIREVARYFGVSTQTVRRQIKRGELSAVRYGGQLRIPRIAINRIEETKS